MAHHRPAEPREQMSPQERAETRKRSMALLRQMLRPASWGVGSVDYFGAFGLGFLGGCADSDCPRFG